MALFIYKWARRGHDRMVVVFTALLYHLYYVYVIGVSSILAM
jgi:hypothetical protein